MENDAADVADVKKRHTSQLLSKVLGTQTRPKEYLKLKVIKRYYLYLQTLSSSIFLDHQIMLQQYL